MGDQYDKGQYPGGYPQGPYSQPQYPPQGYPPSQNSSYYGNNGNYNPQPPMQQGYYPTPQPQTVIVQQVPEKNDNKGLCLGFFGRLL